jgi:hypothetical protein
MTINTTGAHVVRLKPEVKAVLMSDAVNSPAINRLTQNALRACGSLFSGERNELSI